MPLDDDEVDTLIANCVYDDTELEVVEYFAAMMQFAMELRSRRIARRRAKAKRNGPAAKRRKAAKKKA